MLSGIPHVVGARPYLRGLWMLMRFRRYCRLCALFFRPRRVDAPEPPSLEG